MKTTRLIEIFEHDKEAKAVRELIDLANEHHRRKYASIPDYARPRPKFDSRTANGLTSCITSWLLFKGFKAWRQSSEGRYRPGQVVTDVIGRRRELRGQWLPGQNNGAADVCAIVRGRFIAVEVKIGQDKQSHIQKAYQKEIEDSGGVYFVARSFSGFLQWFNSYKDYQ